MMTKKHFKAIAEIVEGTTDTNGTIERSTLISRLSRYFGQDNPNFDADKFREACYHRSTST